MKSTLLASKECPCTYCKSLWIKMSAKLLNVNLVNAWLSPQVTLTKLKQLFVQYLLDSVPFTLPLIMRHLK